MIRIRTLSASLFLVAIVLLATATASAESDSYGNSSFHPFTIDPSNGTCLGENCDPVNLIFPDQGVAQVQSALEGYGWSTTGWGSSQQMHFADEGVLHTQDVQLALGGLSNRFHMRLWQDPDNPTFTVGGVHHEVLDGFSHVIDASWEAAEAYVAGQLCGTAYVCDPSGILGAQMTLQAQDLDFDADPGTWRGWENNLLATVFALPDSNNAPAFISEPVVKPPATLGVAYVDTLADVASDPDGDVLNFSKISGPAWLDVGQNGALTGTPGDADEGSNSWQVQVSDGKGGADQATLEITVQGVNQPPLASFTYTCNNLTCSFDGGGSSDADGSISSYSWLFGDGNSGSGVTLNHTYGEAGSYTVTLTVTDNDGATGDENQSITVPGTTVDEMHLQALELTVVNLGRGNKAAQAKVTVVDRTGSPINGATVTGSFSGNTSSNGDVITDANGVAFFESPSKKGSSNWGFCVDDVAHSDWTYNALANEVGECAYIGSEPPPPPSGGSVHIGDLEDNSDTALDGRGRWEAVLTVTAHDGNETVVANVTISGNWSNGAKGNGSCTTDGSGSCRIAKANLKGDVNQVTFIVEDIIDATGAVVYDPLSNHDDNGGGTVAGDGTISIVLSGP